MFDFSIFKNINFSRPETLIFLGILVLFFAIAGVICFLVVKFFLKLLNIVIKKVFNSEYSGRNQGADLGVNVKQLENSRQERAELESKKFVKTSLVTNINIPEHKTEAENKSAEESYREKEQKDIAEDLARLKIENKESKETLESRLPSREEKTEDNHERIHIPKPKEFEQEENNADIAQPQPVSQSVVKPAIPFAVAQANKFAGPVSTPMLKNDNVSEKLISQKEKLENKIISHIRSDEFSKPASRFSVSSDKQSQKENIPVNKSSSAPSASDSFLFGNKEVVSRRNLAYKLRYAKYGAEAEIVKAQKAAGLNLSREQQTKLIEKYFPKFYGQDISKKEFKKQIKVLERKASATAGQRLQTKRELGFLKKISGVK